jgi:hypothetical protein
MRRRGTRWSDNDHNFGPFTYAYEPRGGYRPFGVQLSSGDDDERICQIRFSGFGHTLIIALPPIIRPHKVKVVPAGWDEQTIKRLGRNWYWDKTEREYGFTIVDNAVHLHYGRQSHDISTEQSKCWFIPWLQWRHVRRSLYDVDGKHFWTEPERKPRALGEPWGYEAVRAAQDACPSMTFNFRDFDGDHLTAKTRIEEREWRLGEGWFKWLSAFAKPRIRRSLDISFSGETGKRKGSWKGGTLGHSIEMTPGELHHSAFRRYCEAHEMTFLGQELKVDWDAFNKA